jgi:hypothetical protein
MMFVSRKSWLLTVSVAGLVLTGANVWAQKPIDKTEAEKTAEVVEQIALAAELTAFGRGELAVATGLKDVRSPEALVAAGGILLRVHKQTAGQIKALESKVVDDADQAVPEESTHLSFADDAASLFDEARAMAKDKAAVEAQIKQAESVTERGASGGPKVISRTVKPGKTHKVDIAFEPHTPATVTMRGNGKVKFEVVGPGGKILWHSQGSWGVYHWQPGKASERGITIKVVNSGGPPVSYIVTTN